MAAIGTTVGSPDHETLTCTRQRLWDVAVANEVTWIDRGLRGEFDWRVGDTVCTTPALLLAGALSVTEAVAVAVAVAVFDRVPVAAESMSQLTV